MTLAEYPPELPVAMDDHRPTDTNGAEQKPGDHEEHGPGQKLNGAERHTRQVQNNGDAGDDVQDDGDHGSVLPQTGADAAPTLSDVYDDLDRFMIGEPLGEDAGEGMPDQDVANARLRRYGRKERELAMVEEIYRAELERLKVWAEGRREAVKKAMAADTMWLTDWHRAQLGRHRTGPLTINLPAGKLRAVANQPAVEIDETEFMAWAAAEAPELIRTPEPKEPVPAPDRAALRKRVTALKIPKTTEAGETFTVVPGVLAVAQGDRFVVEPDMDLDPT